MPSKLKGDWKRAGVLMNGLITNLFPVAEARMYENGTIVLKRMIEHIDRQDLNWEDLSERTIQLKQGDDTIYVETGWLKGNLGVRRIKSTVKGSTLFVGASPWKTHPESQLKFSDLMIMLEYGTEDIPPRPLVRPTWEELEKDIKRSYKKAVLDLIKRGGRR